MWFESSTSQKDVPQASKTDLEFSWIKNLIQKNLEWVELNNNDEKVLKGYLEKKDPSKIQISLFELIKNNPIALVEIINNLPLEEATLKRIEVEYKDKIDKSDTKKEQKIDKTEFKINQEMYSQTLNLREKLWDSFIEFKNSNPEKLAVAKKEIQTINPSIEGEELEAYIDTYLLISNRGHFIKNNPVLTHSFDELQKTFESDRTFKSINIRRYLKNNSNLLDSEIKFVSSAITNSSYGLDIQADKIVSWDEIIVFEDWKFPKKFIWNENFKLESKVEFSPWYEYILQKEKIKKEYEKLNKQKRFLIDSSRETKDRQKDFEDIKNIQTKNSLWEDVDIKKEQAKNKAKTDDLNNQIKRIDEQLRGLEEKAVLLENNEKNRLNLFYKNQTEKDKQTRETIQFIKDIGLDLIPQTILNQILNWIRGRTIYVNWLDINTQALDLENQRFGDPLTLSNGTQWKINLIRFYNKLIFGKVKPENTILRETKFLGEFATSVHPPEIIALLTEKGLLNWKSYKITKMIKNLGKNEDEE